MTESAAEARAGSTSTRLAAIDVHVHLHTAGERTARPTRRPRSTSAQRPLRDWDALAEYYRSRRMACVVFTVDERLSGRPPVANDAVLDFAAAERRHRDSPS